MNSRWQANKIGLVNFWYYDEQEFPFAKGRMLLRGSNGSGKSVTMQSVVPLLLDGNASPERLDPFGTRDRKMSNYLLEEDDGREERTGYLYLEFRRKESQTYLTIGMGLRARRGKPLERWYFSLSDGRRMGKDFFLYKKTGEKIPLTKKELENRIGEGGRVFDRQKEYMEYVNAQIFGFETLDEYKELIDLLIQLRTPKLSKDFKPSVINEILSDSLQPLSDEDLRPMSEAIENMDTMNMNLKAREEAGQAADKIGRVFDKYNKYCLYEKASLYSKKHEKFERLQNEQMQRVQKKKQCEQNVRECEEEKEQLEIRNRSMQKERETLDKSDAVGLKKRQEEIAAELKNYEKTVADKEKNLEDKKEQRLDVENRVKEEEDRQYEKESQIRELLEEMQEDADDMEFQEHAFFKEELLSDLKAPYSYELLQKQINETREKIQRAFSILEKTREWEKQADELTKQREAFGSRLDGAQRRQMETEKLLVQTGNEWKEKLFNWGEACKELVMSPEQLKEISHFADDYNAESDFVKIRKNVWEVYRDAQMALETEKNVCRAEVDGFHHEYDELKREKEEWENFREPEPAREESVEKNRKRLEELEIPYQEFYKVVEFADGLDEKACDRIEEALLRMGILDALIVDEQYREQVLQTSEGCSDRYLFVQQDRPEKSLLDVLQLNSEVTDIFSNMRLTGILGNIAYGEGADAGTAVYENGIYQLGVLTGSTTGGYRASYIGAQARKRVREERIRSCEEQMESMEKQIRNLEEQYEILKSREEELLQERENFPADTDLREAWKLLCEAEENYERIRQEYTRVEKQLLDLKEKIRAEKEEAFALAKALYLDCTYAVMKEAAAAADGYREHLMELRPAHEMYQASIKIFIGLEEQLDHIEADMDQILYDITVAKRECEKRKQENESIEEQLKLTNYEQIRERLDECLNWLNQYPHKIESCAEKRMKNTSRIEILTEQIEQGNHQLKEYEKQCEYLNRCYQAERKLEYVDIPEDIGQSIEKTASYLASDAKSWNKDDIIKNLNQVFFENRGALNEYQLMQVELFDDFSKESVLPDFTAKRTDILSKYQGVKIPFVQLSGHLKEDIEELKGLIRDGDRELFEDILANTVSRKIRGKINASRTWVDKMNQLMKGMNTSSGLKLSLNWKSRSAEAEQQLDTKELVGLLEKDYRIMSEEEAARLSAHFRSKVEEARRNTRDGAGMVSFYQVMKETLDYRKWFEFQLFSQKTGERKKELTNSVFGTFSGGEKAMSMYVPLFSAVVAKYQGGRQDAPRLISLDEAFAGVDNRNIRDMFRLMVEFEFDFIINSQVLWGDCDTLDALAIYQLQRPQNAKFVAVMPYLWNGVSKEYLEDEEMVEERGAELAADGIR